jgi:ABC-type spermidine/putrescine transport system permease subunit I
MFAASFVRRAPRETAGWQAQRRRVTMTLLSVPVGVMLVMFVLPLLILLWLSFAGTGDWSLQGYRDLAQPVYLRLLGFTLYLAGVVTLICAVLAYPIAYTFAHIETKLNRWMAVGIFVSLWLSFLAKTFGWIIILQRNGIINDLLMWSGLIGSPLRLVYNETGVWIGMVHVLLPFMILTLVPALRAIDQAYIRAALSLGSGPFRTFWLVYFKLSLPGIVAGSILVFTLSFGFFITPAILGGGRVTTIVLAIRDQVQVLGDLRLAAATSMVLLAVCLAVLVVYDRVAGVDRIFGRGRS